MTHLSLSGGYYDKQGFPASDRDYTKNSDLRGFFENDPLFAGDTSLDNRSSIHGWGTFVYDGAGRQSVRPNEMVRDNGSTYDVGDCTHVINADICLDGGSGDRALRGNRNSAREVSPDSNRFNLFGYLSHQFDSDVEFYSEVGYYKAEVEREREAAGGLSNSRFRVPADYYWNPLGPVTFDDGRLNPNRVVPAGDPGVPDEGLGFTLRTFAPFDVGPRMVSVEDESFRFVAGFRGGWSGWDWDSGIVYSEAETVDSTDNRVSSTLFQQSLMLDTEDAYNVFTGWIATTPPV